MPRDFRLDIGGYNVAIRHFEKEYKRALHLTSRSKDDYEGSLDRIQWLLDLCRREQRELADQARGQSTPVVRGAKANGAAKKKKPSSSRPRAAA